MWLSECVTATCFGTKRAPVKMQAAHGRGFSTPCPCPGEAASSVTRGPGKSWQNRWQEGTQWEHRVSGGRVWVSNPNSSVALWQGGSTGPGWHRWGGSTLVGASLLPPGTAGAAPALPLPRLREVQQSTFCWSFGSVGRHSSNLVPRWGQRCWAKCCSGMGQARAKKQTKIKRGINVIGNNFRHLMCSGGFGIIGYFLDVSRCTNVPPVSFPHACDLSGTWLSGSPFPFDSLSPQFSCGVCIFPPTMSPRNHKCVICVPTLVF